MTDFDVCAIWNVRFRRVVYDNTHKTRAKV